MPRHTRPHRQTAMAALLTALSLLGGCTLLANTGRDRTMITLAEKEELGYERPEDAANPSLQRQANKHRRQIFDVVEPIIAEQLGRAVEITTINATYPYDAVDVGFRTLDEPMIASTAFVPLNSDGTVPPGTAVDAEASGNVSDLTVAGLWAMAHRDEVAAAASFIEQQFPETAPLPAGYREYLQMTSEYFHFGVSMTPGGDRGSYKRELTAILAAFNDDSQRTDDEWLSLFDQLAPSLVVNVGVKLVATDPERQFSQAEVEAIGEAMRTRSPLSAAHGWGLEIRGDLVTHDGRDFHEYWITQFNNPQPRWITSHKVDGANA